MVPEALAFMDVRNVHLDHRLLERVERIEDGDRGVGEGRGIDDDTGAVLARLMDPFDNLVFAIALVKADLVPEFVRTRRQSLSTSASVSCP